MKDKPSEQQKAVKFRGINFQIFAFGWTEFFSASINSFFYFNNKLNRLC